MMALHETNYDPADPEPEKQPEQHEEDQEELEEYEEYNGDGISTGILECLFPRKRQGVCRCFPREPQLQLKVK